MNSSVLSATEPRVTEFQRTLEQRFANPALRRLLQSPLHPLVSRWFLLVSYVGKRSGRRYTFPVAYATAGEDLVVVTPKADSNWWKNFRTPMMCYVWYRGDRRTVIGEVVTGETATRLLDNYVSAHRLMARGLGFSGDQSNRAAELDDARKALAVVRFSLG
ncbi:MULTISPECIES: hypothetical protein [Haloferax]|uniref:hypothetical protein n=1 Tax=Haloferax TaxID=2251 RepID=UPI001CDA24A5|nr:MULTISPECIES: hypothetical protein [Haloferax]